MATHPPASGVDQGDPSNFTLKVDTLILGHRADGWDNWRNQSLNRYSVKESEKRRCVSFRVSIELFLRPTQPVDLFRECQYEEPGDHPTILPCDARVSSGPIITKKARLSTCVGSHLVWPMSEVTMQDNKVCHQSTLV